MSMYHITKIKIEQVQKRTYQNTEGRSAFLSVKRISKFGAGAIQASELADQGACKSYKKVMFVGIKQFRRVPKCNWRQPVQARLLINRLEGNESDDDENKDLTHTEKR